MPSFTWLDEEIEHSEQDEAKATAIAKRLTVLQSNREQQSFRRMSDDEEGRYYDPSEDCECDFCLKSNHRCDEEGMLGSCSLCAMPVTLTECETAKGIRIAEATRVAEVDLEEEWLYNQLESLGARLMRPYEHWNEDERYMEYMENRY